MSTSLGHTSYIIHVFIIASDHHITRLIHRLGYLIFLGFQLLIEEKRCLCLKAPSGYIVYMSLAQKCAFICICIVSAEMCFHMYLYCYVCLCACICSYESMIIHGSRSTILVIVQGDAQVDYGRRTGYISESY